MDAHARDEDTCWYYEFLRELLRNGILTRYMSQLNREGVDNLIDVPALSDAWFAVDCGHDEGWRIITRQGKAIIMGEFAGSSCKPGVSLSDTTHSLVFV